MLEFRLEIAIATVLIASGLALVSTAGCGDSGGGSPCGEMPATCSDDPTGSFQVVSVCGLRPVGCTQATSSIKNHTKTGTLTVNADGSAGTDLELEFSYTTKVPLSCGMTCEEVDDVIGLCDESGDKCVCDGWAGMGISSGFSWYQEGSDIILDFGASGTGSLCVSGDMARSHFYDGLELLWERI